MKIELNGCKWVVKWERRGEPGCWLEQECGWPFAQLSLEHELRGVCPEEGWFWAKTWGENSWVVRELEKAGKIEFSGRVIVLTKYAQGREARLVGLSQ